MKNPPQWFDEINEEPTWRRRREDKQSKAGVWTVLLVSVFGWASTFCFDMAQEESFSMIMTPKFLGLHIGQLFSFIVSVLAAKKL